MPDTKGGVLDGVLAHAQAAGAFTRRMKCGSAIALVLPILCGCPAWVQKSLYKDYRPAPLVDSSATQTQTGLTTNDPFGTLVASLENAGYLAPSCFVVTASQASAASAAPAPNPVTSNDKQIVSQLDCQTQRNYIVTVLVAKSNDTCEAHKATMFGNEASWNVSLGTLTNAFTGTAAVVGGPVGKSIFSALGLFANAERSLVNEEVYQNLLVPAISEKIDEIRSTKLSVINTNMKTDVNTYSMYQAISDVMEYHNDCSFMLGLQTALKEGTSGGISTQYNALLRAEQSLTAQIDQRKASLAGKTPADSENNYKNDDKLQKLYSRLDSIEDQLKVVETLPMSKTATGN